MPSHKVVQFLLVVIALLGATGCSLNRKPVVAIPPPPPREAPSLAQNLPLSHTFISPLIKGFSQARLDPVVWVISKAEDAFRRGEREYTAGHMEAAKDQFNIAIQELLQAPKPVVADKRLLQKLDYLVARIHAYELEALKQGDGFTEQFYEPAPLDEMATITIPENISAAELQKIAQEDLANTASDLPLVVNKRVAAFIKFFCCTRRGREALEGGLQRSGRYRDMILRILQEEGVPQDLIYLAQAESNFHAKARSRAAAVGLWQFIRGTGKLYGLERTWWADDRLDPEKATRAAAKHLKDLYDEFGNWYLAMAGYNTGAGNVKRAIRRTGSRDFWKLADRRALYRETRSYIPIIVALTIINKNPEKYGLGDILPEPPVAYETMTVEHPVDLRLASEIVGSNLETIRELNPSLLRMTTPNVPEFDLRIPLATRNLFARRIAMVPPDKRVWWRWHTVHYGETLSGIAKKFKTSVQAIAEVNNLGADERLQEAAELVIPVTRQQPPGGTHRIRPRETLSGLARRYNVSVSQLMMWNQLDTTVIRAGSLLHVGPPTAPPPGSGTYRVRRGDSLSRIANRYRVSVNQLMAWNQLSSTRIHPGQTLRVGTSAASSSGSALQQPPGSGTYRVRRGDSLSSIASRHRVSVDQLVAWNQLSSTRIYPGQTLRVGTSAASSSGSALQQPPGSGTYRVRRGDSLSSIASRHRVSVDQLMAWNQLSSTRIYPGQTLRVGTSAASSSGSAPQQPRGRVVHRVRRGDSLSSIASRYGVSVSQLMAWNQLSSEIIHPGQTLRVETSTTSSSGSAPQQPRESVVHRVRKGESLWEIASNYNISVEALRRTNSHLGRTLHIGDRVVIPAAR